jgi:hypothetical protein
VQKEEPRRNGALFDGPAWIRTRDLSRSPSPKPAWLTRCTRMSSRRRRRRATEQRHHASSAPAAARATELKLARVGPATDPSVRGRALPHGAHEPTARRALAGKAGRSQGERPVRARHANPIRARERPQPRPDRARAQRGGCKNLTRRPAVVAVDGSLRPRPVTPARVLSGRRGLARRPSNVRVMARQFSARKSVKLARISDRQRRRLALACGHSTSSSLLA